MSDYLKNAFNIKRIDLQYFKTRFRVRRSGSVSVRRSG